MEDVVTRYWQRPATCEDVERALRQDPNDDVAPPAGLFVLAVADREPIGCGGVRFHDDGVAELCRVWVVRAMRRHGIGTRIVARLEQEAVTRGQTCMRLDTRRDLIEARALYARLGYREVPPFNDAPYADQWFEKQL